MGQSAEYGSRVSIAALGACVLWDMYSGPRNHVYLIFLAAELQNVKRVNLRADPLNLEISRTGKSLHRCL